MLKNKKEVIKILYGIFFLLFFMGLIRIHILHSLHFDRNVTSQTKFKMT